MPLRITQLPNATRLPNDAAGNSGVINLDESVITLSGGVNTIQDTLYLRGQYVDRTSELISQLNSSRRFDLEIQRIRLEVAATISDSEDEIDSSSLIGELA